jgi:hypothetical protein
MMAQVETSRVAAAARRRDDESGRAATREPPNRLRCWASHRAGWGGGMLRAQTAGREYRGGTAWQTCRPDENGDRKCLLDRACAVNCFRETVQGAVARRQTCWPVQKPAESDCVSFALGRRNAIRFPFMAVSPSLAVCLRLPSAFCFQRMPIEKLKIFL